VPVKFPVWLVVTLNVSGWPIIHLAVAWIFTQLSAKLFASEPRWMQPRPSEASLYARVTKIRNWKRLLPDGAPWLRGFPKQNLRSKDAGYLQSFITETRRGEAAHWVMMLAGAVFLLWNPLWADGVMVGYAVAANLPCIITQRYNRFRLSAALRGRRSSQSL
jgi:glycosyl-4,4'-diaponeurosporenoate acyltransferase